MIIELKIVRKRNRSTSSYFYEWKKLRNCFLFLFDLRTNVWPTFSLVEFFFQMRRSSHGFSSLSLRTRKRKKEEEGNQYASEGCFFPFTCLSPRPCFTLAERSKREHDRVRYSCGSVNDGNSSMPCRKTNNAVFFLRLLFSFYRSNREIYIYINTHTSSAHKKKWDSPFFYSVLSVNVWGCSCFLFFVEEREREPGFEWSAFTQNKVSICFLCGVLSLSFFLFYGNVSRGAALVCCQLS